MLRRTRIWVSPLAVLVAPIVALLVISSGSPGGTAGADTVIDTVSVGSKPQGVGVNPTNNNIYVTRDGPRVRSWEAIYGRPISRSSSASCGARQRLLQSGLAHF